MDLAGSAKSTHRITDWIIITSFLFIIGIILLGTIFSWDFYGVQENRILAKKPVFSISNLPQVRTQFEVYLNDHFGFRNTLIRRYNKLMQQYLGRKPQKVLLGGEKWLFLNEDISDYLGYGDTTKEDLERWRLVLEGRHAWLAEKGICYIFVVAPNKEIIYSEYLPKEIGMSKGETRLEKLIKYMKENSDVQILDLRPALLEAKKQQQVYFSTDTHWNGYGAFLGYQLQPTVWQAS